MSKVIKMTFDFQRLAKTKHCVHFKISMPFNVPVNFNLLASFPLLQTRKVQQKEILV